MQHTDNLLIITDDRAGGVVTHQREGMEHPEGPGEAEGPWEPHEVQQGQGQDLDQGNPQNQQSWGMDDT